LIGEIRSVLWRIQPRLASAAKASREVPLAGFAQIIQPRMTSWQGFRRGHINRYEKK
jgi:hypothetical protein